MLEARVQFDDAPQQVVSLRCPGLLLPHILWPIDADTVERDSAIWWDRFLNPLFGFHGRQSAGSASVDT